MKSLENIKKAMLANKVNYASIINNSENVSIEDLSDNELFSVAIYDELRKAIDTKEYALVLDCNYRQSKFHLSEQYKVDYYRLVSRDTKNASMIQFYVSANFKKCTVSFHLCTSCARMNREQFISLENELHFTVKYNSDRTRAKTSERKKVTYDELCDIVKSVCSVLANTAKQSDNSKSDNSK